MAVDTMNYWPARRSVGVRSVIALSVRCGESRDGQAVALVLIDEIVGWRAGPDDLLARFAHRFGRAEPRRQAPAYPVGLLSPLATKNGWTFAEARWLRRRTDAAATQLVSVRSDAVRDDVFAYA
ncbi:hypothetical protein ACIA47_32295 [Micromonospora sp. NPDC051227]|uniref:hypothetical protein n=1 Tax=Micromonospora sp. NPDC051227 TaxID=3364285 RepID=UPI0037B2185A